MGETLAYKRGVICNAEANFRISIREQVSDRGSPWAPSICLLTGVAACVAARPGTRLLGLRVYRRRDPPNRQRRGLPNIKKYEDRVDLLPRLRALMAARAVQVTLYTGGSLDHQNCHRRARQRLREEIGLDARRQHHLALTRQRSRLTQLIEERGGLIHRLGKLDEEISIAQVHAEALLLLMRTAGSPNIQCGSGTE